MPNPLIYASTTPDHSLHKGGVAVGVNSVEYNPSNGWVNGAIPTDWDYVIYKTTSGANPNIFAPANEQEFYNFVLMQGGSASDVTSVGAALAWIATQSDLLALHSSLPNIVTDSLVLALDAGDVSSYPTTGTTWYGVSGEGNSATLTNGPTFVDNNYISFDGINDYAPFTTEYAFSTGNGTMFSLEMWFQMRTLPTANYAANGHIWGGENGNDVVVILNPASNGISKGIICYDDSRYNAAMMTTGGFEANTWYQWVITGNGTNNTVTHYINGELDRGPTGVLPTSQYIRPWNGTRFARDTRWNTYSTLNLATARQYMKELTASEVLQNYYQAPIVTDGLVFAVDAGNLVSYENGDTTTNSLTGSADGTLTNGVGFDSANGGTWNFDGTNDYITLPSSIATSLNGGEEASLNMWVKLNSNSNSVANTGIIQLSGYSNGNGNLYWYQNGYTYLDIFITTRYRVWINTVLDPRNWHMLTITTTSGTNGWKAYLNGILQFQTTGQSTVSVNSTIQGGLTLGENSGGRYTNGNIASCFIYDKALTADEVQQNFQAQSSRFI